MLLQKCYLTRLFLIAASTVEPSNCTDYDVSLAEGATANEGKIKVCLNHFWGTVCDGYLDTTDASVLCRQLGFPSLGIHLVENITNINLYLESVFLLFRRRSTS